MKLNVGNLFKRKEAEGTVVVNLKDASSVTTKEETSQVSTDVSNNKNESEIIEETTTTCPKCKQVFSKQEIKDNLNVCVACGHHYVISADKRLRNLVDKGTFKPLKCKVAFTNPLEYPDYEDKILSLQEKTGLDEAVLAGTAKIDGYDAVVAVMSSKFLMGSMGIAVGEKITNAVEYADKKKLPLIIFTASGGARMQEGILSLMQMAKTSAAVEKFNNNGGLYISVLTHPTTGGVTASFATLGDITLAEPEALIGFAGPRVIEQTIGQKLPEGFQRSEFLQEHGFVDQIVPRDKMRETIAHILRLHSKRGK
ncbi:MAG: acetyl-CoA carboxylase carboxyltransferase subunit beta [Lachnospiraceae bacterium]|nr:acetyl-CoA carboxylase carboxyltransferase subunit beta [Lachnospiraceae bacterium]